MQTNYAKKTVLGVGGSKYLYDKVFLIREVIKNVSRFQDQTGDRFGENVFLKPLKAIFQYLVFAQLCMRACIQVLLRKKRNHVN